MVVGGFLFLQRGLPEWRHQKVCSDYSMGGSAAEVERTSNMMAGVHSWTLLYIFSSAGFFFLNAAQDDYNDSSTSTVLDERWGQRDTSQSMDGHAERWIDDNFRVIWLWREHQKCINLTFDILFVGCI